MGTEEAQAARAALALRTCEAEVAGLFGAQPPRPLPITQGLPPPRRLLPISPSPSLAGASPGTFPSGTARLTVTGHTGAQRTCRRAWRLCGRE